MLIIASTDLQKEIVEGGRVSHTVLILNPELAAWICLSSTSFVSEIKPRAVLLHLKMKETTNSTNSTTLLLVKGAATIKEFYARNSRWTEGLISAAKAVGWGATEMVYVIQNIT